MADAVNTQIVENGPRNLIMKFTNNSDGTGETDVVKVNVSTLALSLTSLKIRRIIYNVTSGAVIIKWDATTDNVIAVLSGYGDYDMRNTQGMFNPATTGNTGNILFSTKTFTAPSAYTITLDMTKGNLP